MKIKTISYKNFKGFKSFDLDLDCINKSILGDNETGKTTVFDGFIWLLFDKDSLNQANFNIKPVDQVTGEDIHGLDTEVIAVIENKGIDIELKKIYYEKWTKSKGSTERTFSGNTTDYYIDSVPVKKKEYDEKITSFADEQTFKLLTNPLYFNEQMHWTDRRELLIKICGDVENSDIILREPKLKELEDILNKRTIDDHRKVLQEQRKNLNKDIEKIPTRIDEQFLSKPDISKIDFKGIEAVISDLSIEADKIRQSIAEAKNGAEIGKQTLELAKTETLIVKLKSKYTEDNEQLIKLARHYFNEATSNVETAERELRRLTSSRVFKAYDLKDVEDKLTMKRDEWTELNKLDFYAPETPDTCFNCGQKMPDVDNSKAEESFNLEKSKNLALVKKNATDVLVPLKEKYEQELQEIEKNIMPQTIIVDDLKATLEEKKKTYDTAKGKQLDVTKTEEYQELIAQKEAIATKIANLKLNIVDIIEKYNLSLSDINTGISAHQTILAKKEQHDKATARIEELKAEEQALAKKIQAIDKELYLTDLYIKSQISLLDSKINSKFKMARFKLFNTLVNGGIEPVCECTYKGVPYSSMNNAARINVGIDIINTISEFYDFTAPIFIDNAEAVTKYIETEAQLIKLIVSEQDKELRIEV